MYWIMWSGRELAFHTMIDFWKNEIEKLGRIIYTVFAPKLTGSAFFFFIFLLLYFCKSVDYIVSLIYKSEINVLLPFVLPIHLFLILFWNNYKFILLCMWFVPVLFCIQVTTSYARICVRMCVCVSRFALINNHAHTRVCWDTYFIDYQLFINNLLCCVFVCCWKSIVYKLF